jgi:hypothetical protein
METHVKFRFVTKAFSEDYRVYGDGGKRTFSDLSEFDPLRQKGRFIPEDGPCVVLFEEKGNIFLVASGLSRGARDLAGRTMRFSFCQIFDDKGQASAAFLKLTGHWTKAEEKMQSLIQEIEMPRVERKPVMTTICFDEESFMGWLQEEKPVQMPFTTCKEGQMHPTSEASSLWPARRCFLKWLGSEPEQVTCGRIGKVEVLKFPADRKKQAAKNRFLFAAGAVGLAAVFFFFVKPQNVRMEEVNAVPAIEPSVVSMDVTSDDAVKVELPVISLDVTSDDAAKVELPVVSSDVTSGDAAKVELPVVSMDVISGDAAKVEPPVVSVDVTSDDAAKIELPVISPDVISDDAAKVELPVVSSDVISDDAAKV